MIELSMGEIQARINNKVSIMLEAVFFTDESVVMLGENGTIGMALSADGRGNGGQYDRVHVLYEDGKHVIYIAHNLEGFRAKP